MRSSKSLGLLSLASQFIVGLFVIITPTSLLQARPQGNEATRDAPNQETKSAQPTVTLLEAGQAPHRVLRLRPTVGSKMRHDMEMSMTMGSIANGQKSPSRKIPTVRYTMDSTVTEVASNGDVSFTVEYSDATVLQDDDTPLELVAGMDEMTTSMIGLQIKSTVDHRGFSKGVTLQLPAGIAPAVANQISQISQSVEQLTSPYPEEAVGVGGKWKVVSPMESGGMKFVQTMEYTVVDMTDDTLNVTVSVRQDAEEHELDLPDAEVTARLRSLECLGNGRSKLNLTAVLAEEANVKVDVKVVIIVDAGQEVEVVQDVTTEVQFKAVPLPKGE